MINLIHIHKYIHIYYTNIIHAYSADIHIFTLSTHPCLVRGVCVVYPINELSTRFSTN